MPEVQVKFTHPDAKLPKFAHDGDACADVCSVEDVTIRAGGTKIVDLGFQVAFPDGWEIQVRSRSGLAAKNGVFVLNSPGTIDSPYRGPCKVILHNAGDEPFEVKKGDRIAQFAMRPVPKNISFKEVSFIDEDTNRGTGGLGSTGLQ